MDTLGALLVLGIPGIILWVWIKIHVLKDKNKNLLKTLDARNNEVISEQDKILKLKNRIEILDNQLKDFESEKRKFADVKDFAEKTLKDWEKQSATFPILRDWADRVRSHFDDLIVRGLTQKPRPATAAAAQVKEARANAREYKKEAERLAALLAIYEAQAPWLSEYTDYTVEEILEGVKEEETLKEIYKNGEDPASYFLTKTEWNQLSTGERNQVALDRYWMGSRKKTAWTAGIQYERFVGYQYEIKGSKVQYHGALNGVDDLGIDLVCTNGSTVHVVQCKRLSPVKEIPVRENVIAQVYGAAKFYALEKGLMLDVIPVLVTTYECSEMARMFAKHLGVQLVEKLAFKPYPCIKCNVSQLNGEKIYHLPFDLQYDATQVGDMPGEFYAMTVAEAEVAGFRRAFRWRG